MLKNDYRDAAAAGVSPEVQALLSQKYRDVTRRLPEIPNVLFNPLKSAHLRKLEVSRALSQHPGWVPFVRVEECGSDFRDRVLVQHPTNKHLEGAG